MRRFRTQWLAAFGAALLLALSVSGALGARPLEHANGEPNRGLQVSTFVHGLIFGTDDSEEEENQEDEEVEEEEVDEEEENQEEEEGDESLEQANSHGACVRLVAQSDEVGGPNENHGGAVSFAAQVTCWEEFAGEEGDNGEDGEDGEDGEELTEEPTTEALESAGPGKSAAAHERNAERKQAKLLSSGGNGPGNGHGHGRGGGH